MAILKVRVAEGRPIPHQGEHFDTDDQGHIGEVVTSFPEIGDPNILVKVDDEPRAYAALSASNDTVGDPRSQHEDYHPLWLRGSVDPEEAVKVEDIQPDFAIDDTFELSGITDVVREEANWGAGVFACCVDTGIDASHQAFAGKDIHQWSPNGGDATDNHGHGTFVLSQLGGVYGILSDSPLGMFQGLPSANGSGSEQTVAAAIRAAADYIQSLGLPQDRVSAIVSMSLGGSDSSVIKAATQYLLRLPNVKVFCAAGNDGPGADIGSPANTSPYNGNSVFVVGAADRSFTVASFSSGGATDPRISSYQFGVQIVGAARNTGDGFVVESGTSMATPFNAGLGGLHGAMGRSASQIQSLLGTARQHQLNPPAQNGKGVVQLSQDDFGVVPAPEPTPTPEPTPPPPPPDVADQELVNDMASANTAYQSVLASYINKVDVSASLKSLSAALTTTAKRADVLSAPVVPPVPVPTPPAETVKPGGTATFRYASDTDAQHRLVVRRPAGAVKCTVVCFNGGGWMSDDSIPLWSNWDGEVEQVTNWFVQQGTLFIEAFYDVGNAERSYRDGLAALDFTIAHCREWGGDPARVAVGGHSAGGWIALRAALTRQVWRVFTLAGAIPSLDGAKLPALTYQILQQTWGPQQGWNAMTPKAHLTDGGKLKGVAFHGSADDQIPVALMDDFVKSANRGGHSMEANFQLGGTHFSIVPTQSRVTENRLIQMFNES